MTVKRCASKTKDEFGRLDFYATPIEPIRNIMKYISALEPSHILDPCAGEGDLLFHLLEQTNGNCRLSGYELGSKSDSIKFDDIKYGIDSLNICWSEADVVVMNPPYCLSTEFASKGIAFVKENPERNHVFILMALDFLSSGKRVSLLHKNMPDVYVLSKRPSFSKNGKTSSQNYAWFHWHKASIGTHKSIVRVL